MTPFRHRIFLHGLLSLLLAFIAGCARLPEYARPRLVQTAEPEKALASAFPYRGLTPGDFRAASLSEDQLAHGDRIKAHAAIMMRVTPDSRFKITNGDFFGQRYFFGRIEHLAFEAVMLPDRSYWSPSITPDMRGYVLQHEQIHFALTEIEARQLTRDTQKWASEVMVIQPTPQAVRTELFRQVKEKINAAMEANLKRQAKFDEDTSLSFNPRWQQWWFETVEKELEQTRWEDSDPKKAH
jgi:hypothetical protein